MYRMKVYEAPQMSRTSKGRAIVNLLELRPDERCVEFMPIEDFEKGEHFLVFATRQGLVKRTSLRLYRNVHRGGLNAVRLNEGDALVGVTWTSGHDHLLLATRKGMAIRFAESDVRPMGRVAAGVKGITLSEDDEVVALVRIGMQEADESGEQRPEATGVDLLTLTEKGYGKRTDLDEYLVHSEQPDGRVVKRPQSRGGKGRIDIRVTARNGPVAAARAVTEEDDVVLVTQGGLLVRIPASSVSKMGRNTQGVRVINLKPGDRLIAAARAAERDDEDD
ncbi:MAG: hypothetical protein D6824_05440 [Planctomycetota bacterium]|nr:MAG: hypothetical protein D6824_05440 [Planctomycetota bacterium]